MNHFGIAFLLLFFSIPALAIDPTVTTPSVQKTHEKTRNGCFQTVEPALCITPGVGDEPPKVYYLRPFTGPNTNQVPASAGSACLSINKGGASITLFPGSLGQLGDLNRESAIRIFGNPDATSDHPDYSTFHLIGSNRTEPNIFHLDVKFDNAENLQEYRIRGLGISHPTWQ